MNSFGDLIRQYRLDKGLSLRVVAASLEIDQAILSKVECGKRRARRDLVAKLAQFYNQDTEYLLRIWLSERILDELAGEADPEAVLLVAEETLAYRKTAYLSKTSLLRRFKSIMEDFPAIKKAWVFGSFARNMEGAVSDIDILIEVPEHLPFTLFDMAEVRKKLQDLSPRRIDLVLSRALKQTVFERIKKERILFYEAG